MLRCPHSSSPAASGSASASVTIRRGGATGKGAGRAADSATHPELRAEIGRIQQLGYLAG